MLENTPRSYAPTMTRDDGKTASLALENPHARAAEPALQSASRIPTKVTAGVLQASPEGVRVPRRNSQEGLDPLSEAAICASAC